MPAVSVRIPGTRIVREPASQPFLDVPESWLREDKMDPVENYLLEALKLIGDVRVVFDD
jgi:hypothetical protein